MIKRFQPNGKARTDFALKNFGTAKQKPIPVFEQTEEQIEKHKKRKAEKFARKAKKNACNSNS